MTLERKATPTVAILFFSHVFDATAISHLKKLKEESAGFGTFFVYSDIHGQDPAVSNEQVVRFDFDAIQKRYPRILGHRLIPGNCHLTLLDFFKRYPDFQYYWVIEYDVMFTGHWRRVFAAFADRDADVLASHLRRYEEEPEWYFWSSIQAPDRSVSPTNLIRAFCPIQRVSRRSLQLLEIKAKEGWVGHFEGLVPTLLNNHGYSLADIGGDGSYVLQGFRNRFYTSFSWRDGRLRYFGSMRFQPSFISLRFAARNVLYHPVKHRLTHYISRSTLLELKEKLFYLVRNLATYPVHFSRALTRLYFW